MDSNNERNSNIDDNIINSKDNNNNVHSSEKSLKAKQT